MRAQCQVSTAMRNAPRQLQRTRLQCHAAPARLCEPAAASALLEQRRRQQHQGEEEEEEEEDGEEEGAAMDAHDEETFDDNDFYTQVCVLPRFTSSPPLNPARRRACV